MASRRPIKANGKYGVIELRAPVRSHPPLVACLADKGTPVVINPDQPLATPRVLLEGRFDLSADVPIDLIMVGGLFRPPAFGSVLEASIARLRRKLFVQLRRIANSEDEARLWFLDNLLPEYTSDENLTRSAMIQIGREVKEFDRFCVREVEQRFPRLGTRRSSMTEDGVQDFLSGQSRILRLLNDGCEWFDSIYSGFCSIANLNFKRERKKVSLGRMQSTTVILPPRVGQNEALDMSFFGLVDASKIYLDIFYSSDILSLAAALGRLALGSFRPSSKEARTFMYVVDRLPDTSGYRVSRATERRRLADALMLRFGLAQIEPELIEICGAVLKHGLMRPQLATLRLFPRLADVAL